MVLKIIEATQAKTGTNILIEGEPHTIRKIDISKTGKHGHAKCRVEAVHMVNNSKKVFVVPGHEKFDVPTVNKNKAQVLSKLDKKASIMNLETFETIEVNCPDEGVFNQLEENGNCEYWDIEGVKIIKRRL